MENETGAVPETKSSFDGTMLQWLGWTLLGAFVTGITCGICYPWACVWLYSWEAKHTVINGKRLEFTGTGGGLIGKWIIWALLSIITVGIYGLWIPVKFHKWRYEHTQFAA